MSFADEINPETLARMLSPADIIKAYRACSKNFASRAASLASELKSLVGSARDLTAEVSETARDVVRNAILAEKCLDWANELEQEDPGREGSYYHTKLSTIAAFVGGAADAELLSSDMNMSAPPGFLVRELLDFLPQKRGDRIRALAAQRPARRKPRRATPNSHAAPPV